MRRASVQGQRVWRRGHQERRPRRNRSAAGVCGGSVVLCPAGEGFVIPERRWRTAAPRRGCLSSDRDRTGDAARLVQVGPSQRLGFCRDLPLQGAGGVTTGNNGQPAPHREPVSASRAALMVSRRVCLGGPNRACCRARFKVVSSPEIARLAPESRPSGQRCWRPPARAPQRLIRNTRTAQSRRARGSSVQMFSAAREIIAPAFNPSTGSHFRGPRKLMPAATG